MCICVVKDEEKEEEELQRRSVKRTTKETIYNGKDGCTVEDE